MIPKSLLFATGKLPNLDSRQLSNLFVTVATNLMLLLCMFDAGYR
jgi:hypothetical protein